MEILQTKIHTVFCLQNIQVHTVPTIEFWWGFTHIANNKGEYQIQTNPGDDWTKTNKEFRQ